MIKMAYLVSRIFYSVLLVVFLTACEAGNESGITLNDEQGIAKSPNDRREYRSLILDNQLKVILISDSETDKAAAAMDIYSGSNSDPQEYAGLAHFLEHMLFLGTAKYIEAGEYQEYIATHGGGHNAYTAYENTNYYFDIEEDYLEPALDRFSQFFIAPLFTSEYVDRERNAVHSEYQSNLKNDGRRSYAAFKAVLNQDHPLSKFSVGSLETLGDNSDGSLRQALLAHYASNYSANIMSLAILGSESLDELEALAVNYFSAIENRNVEIPGTTELLFVDGQLPAQLQIKPIRDSRSLSYTFPIPVVKPYYKSKPLNFLGNLIGHEGEGSLLSLLKARGWANGLSAGGGMSYRDNATFNVSVSLTEEGISRVDEISKLLFQFIELVKQEGIQQWLFEEQKTMAELGFLFQEPSRPIGYVSSLASRLQQYPAAEIITAAYAYEEFDAEVIRMFLEQLTPDNLLLTITEQSVETDRIEPLFGASYKFSALSRDRIKPWGGETINQDLIIPEANPFLPENLAIKPYAGEETLAGVEDKPDIILDEMGVRLWFKQDNEFKVPRANFYFYAMTPIFNDSLEHSLLSSFVVSLINDKLREFTYPANLAGVFYGVSRRSRGFTVRAAGYDDKQHILLEEVMKTIVAADFQQDRFDIIKAERIRRWQNVSKQTPYVRLFQEVQALLVNPYWSEQERIEAVADITLEDVKAFVPVMLSNLHIEALYHGNVTEADALAMMALVSEYLGSSVTAQSPDFGSVVKLNHGERVIQEVEVDHDDSAIVIYLQGPNDTLQTRATINLLASIIRAPFYDTLRTERQLGYVVNAGTMPILKTNGLIMTIESPNADPITLESNIDDFLTGYESELASMSQEMFDDIKSGMLNNLRQKPQRMSSLSGRYWNDILIEEYEEDSTLMMADAIEALDKDQILAYYREHIINPDAGRLVSRSVGKPHQEIFLAGKAEETKDAVIIEQLVESDNAFKEAAEYFYFEN